MRPTDIGPYYVAPHGFDYEVRDARDSVVAIVHANRTVADAMAAAPALLRALWGLKGQGLCWCELLERGSSAHTGQCLAAKEALQLAIPRGEP